MRNKKDNDEQAGSNLFFDLEIDGHEMVSGKFVPKGLERILLRLILHHQARPRPRIQYTGHVKEISDSYLRYKGRPVLPDILANPPYLAWAELDQWADEAARELRPQERAEFKRKARAAAIFFRSNIVQHLGWSVRQLLRAAMLSACQESLTPQDLRALHVLGITGLHYSLPPIRTGRGGDRRSHFTWREPVVSEISVVSRM